MDKLSDNILITGVPRSGTTLTCHLLDKLPNTIALHEPISMLKVMKKNKGKDFVNKMDNFIEEVRKQILTKGEAPSKVINGKIPDNPFKGYNSVSKYIPKTYRKHINFHSIIAKIPSSRIQKRLKPLISLELRPKKHERGFIKISKPLNNDFLLCIKQNEAFLINLKYLTTQFRCYAIIRNPLSVLASWNSVDFKLAKGQSGLLATNPIIHQQLIDIPNKFDRQILLLDFMFQQIHTYLKPEQIIKYKNIICSGGRELDRITPKAKNLVENLSSKNNNPLYDKQLTLALSKKLLKSEGAYWNFYSKGDVEQLIKTL